MEKKGVFIVIEGLDGSGKTTQAKLLTKKLSKNHRILHTSEPSAGKVGRFIRNNILYGKHRFSGSIEALLFAADRVDHLEKDIIPALNDGKIVVSDRYMYSSLAYQGCRGLNLDWIKKINKYALKPDLALFIDVEPEIVQFRLKLKKSLMENLDTQIEVKKIYQTFVSAGELVTVDGRESKSKIAKNIFLIVDGFIRKHYA